MYMREGRRGNRSQKRGKGWVVVLLFCLCLAAVGYYFVSESIVFTEDGFYFAFLGKREPPSTQPNENLQPTPSVTIEKPVEPETGKAEPEPMAAVLDGIDALWVTVDNLKDTAFVNGLISNGVEQIVFTAKDYKGQVYVPFATKYNAVVGVVSADAEKIAESIRRLADNKVVCIAVMSVMRDDLMGRGYRDSAITYGETATIWLDRDMVSWLDPGSELALNYTSELLSALKELGVQHVLLSDMGYPGIGKVSLTGQKPDNAVVSECVREFAEILPVSIVADPDTTQSCGQNLSELSDICYGVAVWDTPNGNRSAKLLSQEPKLNLIYIVSNKSASSDWTDRNVIYTSIR